MRWYTLRSQKKLKLPNLAFRRIPSIFLWFWLLFHLIQGFLSTASRHHPSSFREPPPSLPLWVFDHFALSAQFIAEWFLILTPGILSLTVPIVEQEHFIQDPPLCFLSWSCPFQLVVLKYCCCSKSPKDY